MADLSYQRMVIGYHGCDAAVVAKVLSGKDTLAPTQKDYDWLGNGIYFWEHGPRRAYDWAKAEAKRAPKRSNRRPFLALSSTSASASICWTLRTRAAGAIVSRIPPLHLAEWQERAKE